MKKMNPNKALVFTIVFTFFTLALLTACTATEAETLTPEPILFELPEVRVEADEVPTGYYNIYALESDEIAYESLTSDELEIDQDEFEARPIYALPTFTLTIETDDDVPLPESLTVETDDEGVASFGYILFEEVDTFTYTITLNTEIEDQDDIQSFVIEVEVTKDLEDETLEATLTSEEELIFIVISDEVETDDEDDEESDASVDADSNDEKAGVSHSSGVNDNLTIDSTNQNNNNPYNNSSNSTSNNANHSNHASNNQSSNNTTNSNNQTCGWQRVQVSAYIPGTPGTPEVPPVWGQTPIYYVHVVLPSRTEFAIGQEAARRDYMRDNDSTSFTTVQRGGDSYIRVPGTPAVPGTPGTPAVYEDRQVCN